MFPLAANIYPALVKLPPMPYLPALMDIIRMAIRLILCMTVAIGNALGTGMDNRPGFEVNVRSAGRLMRKRFVIAIMLLSSLIVAGVPAHPIPVQPHTVKRGDTLYAISRSTGTRWISPVSIIFHLLIPSKSGKAEAKQRFRTTAKAGHPARNRRRNVPPP